MNAGHSGIRDESRSLGREIPKGERQGWRWGKRRGKGKAREESMSLRGDGQQRILLKGAGR